MTEVKPVLDIEDWPIDRPIPYARNPRKIPQSAIDKVAASIKEFGFRQPIVVDGERVILAGHTRLLAARKLELATVPVHIARGLTAAQAKAYRLADNRSQDEAKNDFELLGLELAELRDEYDFDLGLTAFEEHEIETLLAADWSPAKIDVNFEAGTKSGNSITFTDEEFAVIGTAITEMRSHIAEQKISDGAALKLICQEFLAG